MSLENLLVEEEDAEGFVEFRKATLADLVSALRAEGMLVVEKVDGEWPDRVKNADSDWPIYMIANGPFEQRIAK